MKKAIIYGRVSSAAQDYTRQVEELKEYASRNGMEVVRIFTEKETGKRKASERGAASDMLRFLAAEKIDVVLVSEISRLGRNARDVQHTVHTITETMKTNLYLHQYTMSAYNPDGSRNSIFSLITDVTANIAQMENETRAARIRSGIEHARKKGKHLGRPHGTTKSIEETKNYASICRNLRAGLSLRKTAKICEVSPATVQKVKKHLSGD